MFTLLVILAAAFDSSMSVQEMNQLAMSKLSPKKGCPSRTGFESRYSKKEITQNKNNAHSPREPKQRPLHPPH